MEQPALLFSAHKFMSQKALPEWGQCSAGCRMINQMHGLDASAGFND